MNRTATNTPQWHILQLQECVRTLNSAISVMDVALTCDIFQDETDPKEAAIEQTHRITMTAHQLAVIADVMRRELYSALGTHS